ncbi:MAG TPA: DUF2085 domain-containing protein [Rubricoccaceae bacterium]
MPVPASAPLPTGSRPSPGWAAVAAAVLAVLTLAAAPPWLGFEGGAAVRQAFAGLCHQLPHRSPQVHGVPFALCHRCTGIVGGLALGVLAGPLAPVAALGRLTSARPLVVLALAATPTGADWLLGVAGVWANTGASRLLTGALFGAVAGLLVAAAFCAPGRVTPTVTPDAV